jgi:molybdopterin-guanine dinucleotide biosynthesis protein A
MRLSGPAGAFRGYVRAVPDQWTAVILSGGRSTRLGFDKATATLGERTLLDWLLGGIPDAIQCVLVGPQPVDPTRPITVAREDPPGGGPVAGIAAGLTHVHSDVVAIVAVDMPLAGTLLPELVGQLLAAPGSVDAVVPVDESGRSQPLAAAYRAASLRAALDRLGSPEGRAVRDLVALMEVEEFTRGPDVGWPALALADVDTPDDLDRLRRSVRADGATAGAKDNEMDAWVAAATKALGIEQSVDLDLILDVAREAAHGVARPAAPVTTFLLGCAVAAGQDAQEAAARLTLLAREWPQPE